MARNAQTMEPGPGPGGSTMTGSTSAYQPQAESVKNPFSTVNISRDPVAAAAQQWASQAVSNFEPPPSYNSSVSNNQPPRQQWDQTFVNSKANSSGDPNNPFK